eukprot:TRINITY_DN3777_c1_g5_i1.p1 TRINITY_DN3777_c1_g5~~TRINITY_DN3777_c1_g5_i1.p1  ORF type:complete len:592 (+),score=109.04 TRINITY_DN3777_c1_g5_i1:76-1851(+)
MLPAAGQQQRVPKRLQDDQGKWLTKSQFRRVNGGHNRRWNATLAKWRAQYRNLDIVELQVQIADRDAALADARTEANLMRQKLSDVRADALRNAHKADQAEHTLHIAQCQAEESLRLLAEAGRRIEQLTADRERAADGRRAARKDARQADAARRRAQRSAHAAERRAGELERRLGSAERESRRIAARLDAVNVHAAYWQQRALSAEGRLCGARLGRRTQAEAAVREWRARCASQEEAARTAAVEAESLQSRLTALEELARGGESVSRRLSCVSAPRTPPRADAESQVEPTLPRSSTPTGSSDEGEPSPSPGGMYTQHRALPAEEVTDICQLALGTMAGEAAVPVQQEEKLEWVLCHTAATQERAGILVRVSRLRAARAELRLLPHSEITERSRLQIEETEARSKLPSGWRHPRAVVDGPTIVSPYDQRASNDVQSQSGAGLHPDAGWFLTLDVISLGVAQFAPRGWAPVCRNTALSVYCVHQHWLTAAREVHQKMVARLDAAAGGPEEERFDWAEVEWEDFINQVRNLPDDPIKPRRILLMHAASTLNHLQRLRSDLQLVGQTMRHMACRIRATTGAMQQILGSEEAGTGL